MAAAEVQFDFEERYPDSPWIERIWRTQSEQAGTFTSAASTRLEIVVTSFEGKTHITVRGPETKASLAPCPAGAAFFGIRFEWGAFMSHLPTISLADNELTFPEASNDSFWLNSEMWQLPDYQNVETFVERLVREQLLVLDPVVEAALQNQPQALSPRTVQRRFRRATGLTQGTLEQIERAHRAVALLEGGASILNAVELAGYADQPHLTRSLKRFVGQTPAQLVRDNQRV